MADPQLSTDTGWWSGVAALATSAGAFLAALIRKPGRAELHTIRNRSHEVAQRTAVIETKYIDMDRRLTRIEDGQIRMDAKLDRLLDRP
jgi:hypothetical protein